MPAVNFYLKKPETGSDQSLIYLQMKYNGQKLVYSFGQKVYPGKWKGKMKDSKKVYTGGNWDFEKQRVKSNLVTTEDGQHSLNDLLDNLDKVLRKGYNDEMKNGIPGKLTLKKYLDDFIYKNLEEEEKKIALATGAPQKSLYKLIDRFIAGEIQGRGTGDKSKSTLDNYHAVKQHLLAYEVAENYKIDFDTITLDFFYSYVSFLKKYKWQGNLGLSRNTIAKDIRVLKVFMSEGIELEWTNNIAFQKKKFSFSEEEVEAVYLTETEVINLYNFDFKTNKKLEQVRDLFVVGCCTGLRYSDYSNINSENIVETDGELFIKMNTQKTGELVIIPCNPIVLQIFRKYELNDNKLPKSISNQKFNDYVKLVCEKAGLIQTGRLMSDHKKKLCECISSHTARRSFATNLYLEGFPTIDLMKITGHKTEKAFLKYIRVSKLDTAKRLSDHMKRNWSSKLLKIAS